MSTNVQRLRKYELHERLGSNNIAEVWKAFDPELQSYVALKIFHANLQNDPAFMTGFWNLPFSQEAQKILSLHHPHIVHIHGFQISRPSDSESPLAYVVMDYIDGSTLANYIRGTSYKGEFPSAAEVVHLFASIGAAVDYVHQQGVIHGHIKPTNILLDKRNTSHNRMGEPMLTDIGITKLLGTSTGALNLWKLDTPLYISPEQVQEHPINEHSDIYCLGVILYEICTGEPPFHGENKQTVMQQHVNAVPPSPSQVQQNISPALSEVIMRGLAKDPAERFPSAASLVTALAEALDISIPKIPSPSVNATNTTSSPTNSNPARPDLSPSSTSSTGTLPSHSAGQPGHADHAIHAMNGQTNRKTKLSVAEFALRPHAPSPETALPSDPAGESAPQFATAVSDGQVVESPGSDSFEGSALAHSAPSSLSTAAGTAVQGSVGPLQPRRRSNPLLFVLPCLLVLVLVGSGLAAFLLIPRSRPTVMHPPPNSLVGHAFFISSGQVSENSSQGIDDELQIDLTGVRDPMAGKSFYAWLLPDQGMTLIPPVLLGKLHVNHGTVHFFYPGDKTHTNLLEMTSRFLVTEEDSDVAPNVPTPDQRAWLYYAAFPQPVLRSSADAAGTPTPDHMMGTPPPDQMGQMSQMGVLDHLRHLLSEAPELKSVGLTGGLDIWLFRNCEKVLQWAGEARDDWQTQSTPLMHRHLVRILQYLDGLGQVWRDAPGEPILVRFKTGQIPLLDMNGQPQVHGFLFLIDLHLGALIQSSGSTPDQRTYAIQVDTAVKNVTLRLQKVYADAKQLVKMTPAQLIQPSSLGLLDDMHTQALYAFAGRLDPATGVVQEGVIQIHYNIQHLATFNVQSYSAHTQSGMGS